MFLLISTLENEGGCTEYYSQLDHAAKREDGADHLFSEAESGIWRSGTF
jgi:hypothetical protein